MCSIMRKECPHRWPMPRQKAVPVIAYGAFINDVINFLIVAFVVFLLVKMVNQAKGTGKPLPRPRPRKNVPIAYRRFRSRPFGALNARLT